MPDPKWRRDVGRRFASDARLTNLPADVGADASHGDEGQCHVRPMQPMLQSAGTPEQNRHKEIQPQEACEQSVIRADGLKDIGQPEAEPDPQGQSKANARCPSRPQSRQPLLGQHARISSAASDRAGRRPGRPQTQTLVNGGGKRRPGLQQLRAAKSCTTPATERKMSQASRQSQNSNATDQGRDYRKAWPSCNPRHCVARGRGKNNKLR
mmetsp:Transcript_40311/g.115242  ORF Transcript_40311/g.115242 Transcript_40311/m.115242 type:complete len:210 (+) Transcript_40311:355-984(+)